MIARREFLHRLIGSAVGGVLAIPLAQHELFGADKPEEPAEARYWRPAGAAVECELCPNQEALAPGEMGRCRVRQNVGGRMVTWGYNRPCILNIDPIEKGPMAHVLPGSEMLTLAHAGCPVRCLYCQNWQFSQKSPLETANIRDFRSSTAVEKARQKQLRGVVFTYSEPGASAEFTIELATLARSKGLRTALCTCGYIMPKPFRELIAPFEAITITYKGATEEFYDKVCDGALRPVLESMLAVKSARKWLEVATLVVPSYNDDAQSLKAMARWIVKNLGADTPWHLERFVPMFKLADLPPTPQATLEQARQIAFDAGLKYVYISNLAPHEGNHTYCGACHKAVITRLGFKVLHQEIRDGRCGHCGKALPGIWA